MHRIATRDKSVEVEKRKQSLPQVAEFKKKKHEIPRRTLEIIKSMSLECSTKASSFTCVEEVVLTEPDELGSYGDVEVETKASIILANQG